MSCISVQIANNTNLNHRNAVLLLIKIHKYFENMKVIWGKSRGRELLILKDVLVFINFR